MTHALLAAAVALGVASCGGAPAGTASGAQSAAESATMTAGAAAAPSGSAEPVSRVVTITSADVPMPPAPTEAAAPPTADAPRRIVSLATGVGETVAALGAADRLVGRDETSDVPAIAAVPVVTKAHAVSAEKVLSLTPDLVLVDAATSPPEALAQIRDTGVAVVEVPEAWALADIEPRTLAVAAAIGVPVAAAQSVARQAVGGTASTTPPAAGPTVAFLYLRGTSAIYLIGGRGSGADALVAAAGGVDAGAAEGLEAFVPLTAEAVAALDPDVILVMVKGLESVGGVDGLVQLPGVAQTRAGRERRVVAVDDTLLLSFGPRTGELVSALAAALATSSG